MTYLASIGTLPTRGPTADTGSFLRGDVPIPANGKIKAFRGWGNVPGPMQWAVYSEAANVATIKALIPANVTAELFTTTCNQAVLGGQYVGAWSGAGAGRISGGTTGNRSYGSLPSPLVVGSTFNLVNSSGSIQVQFDLETDEPIPGPSFDERVVEKGPQVLRQDFTVDLPDLEIRSLAGTVFIPAQTLTIAEPTSVPVAETLTMKYGTVGMSQPGKELSYPYVSDLVITNGTTLVENVDYCIRGNVGLFWGIQNVPQYAVTCTYTGHNQYYGKIVYDPATGALVDVPGPNRRKDADFYKPKVPSGTILLFEYLANVLGVEIMPVRRYHPETGWPLGMEAEHAEWIAYGKRVLPEFNKVLDTGEGGEIWLFEDGDSTSAVGGGGGANQLVANVDRDRLGFFTGLSGDTKTNTGVGQTRFITLYDGSDPDFLGSALTDHVKDAPNWPFIAKMRERGATVVYRNFSTGGTNSTDAQESGPVYNGTHPAKLDAMVAEFRPAPAVNLVCFNEGQNDNMASIGAVDTKGNLIAGVEAVRTKAAARGAAEDKTFLVEFILQTPNQINEWGQKARPDQWMAKQHAVIEAAKASGCHYIPTFINEGSLGLSRQQIAQGYHHPYPAQYEGIGRLKVQVAS